MILLFSTRRLPVALGWVPLTPHAEKCPWAQVVYRRGDPRNFKKGVEKARQEWRESQQRACY